MAATPSKPYSLGVPNGTVEGPLPEPQGVRMNPQNSDVGRPWFPGMDQNTARLRGPSKPYPPALKPRAPFVLR